MLTGERLVVFLFAARVALAAPAYLASPLVVLAAAALAVDGSASTSSPLRRFRTRCAPTLLVLRVRGLGRFGNPRSEFGHFRSPTP
jgi:hypothetical protein